MFDENIRHIKLLDAQGAGMENRRPLCVITV